MQDEIVSKNKKATIRNKKKHRYLLTGSGACAINIFLYNSLPMNVNDENTIIRKKIVKTKTLLRGQQGFFTKN